MEEEARKEHVDYAGKLDHFEGKKREPWHPYDRRSGTGRGKEVAKGGYGMGNWGTREDELKSGTLAVESPKKTGEATAEEVTEAPKEAGEELPESVEKVEVVEEVREEEDEGKTLTLQEYLAQKKKPVIKAESRGHDTLQKKGNLEPVNVASDKVSTKEHSLKDQELYNVSHGENAELLGFKGEEE